MLFTSNLQLWSSQLGFDVKSINAAPIWNITNGYASLSPFIGVIVFNSFSVAAISVYVSLLAIVLLCCNFQVAYFVCVRVWGVVKAVHGKPVPDPPMKTILSCMRIGWPDTGDGRRWVIGSRNCKWWVGWRVFSLKPEETRSNWDKEHFPSKCFRSSEISARSLKSPPDLARSHLFWQDLAEFGEISPNLANFRWKYHWNLANFAVDSSDFGWFPILVSD